MLKSRIPEIAAEIPIRAREVLRETADRIAQSAKDRAPYDSSKPADDPHLRDAIHVEEAVEGFYVVAGNEKVFWGRFVETGAAYSPPHPFLIPAVEENRDQVGTIGAERLHGL